MNSRCIDFGSDKIRLSDDNWSTRTMIDRTDAIVRRVSRDHSVQVLLFQVLRTISCFSCFLAFCPGFWLTGLCQWTDGALKGRSGLFLTHRSRFPRLLTLSLIPI